MTDNEPPIPPVQYDLDPPEKIFEIVYINGVKYKFYRKLEVMKQMIHIDNDTFMTSFQHKEEGARYFYTFDNYHQFCRLIYQLLPPNFYR